MTKLIAVATRGRFTPVAPAIMTGPMAERQANEHAQQIERDVAANEAARRETLRRDGARSLGENLEQADALIRAAFQLAAGMRSARR